MPVQYRPVPIFEKFQPEIINQAVDFAAILDVGETITSCAVTAKRLDTQASAPEVLSGSPSIVGTTVVYRVAAGTAGLSYIISVSATLSSAEVYMQLLQMDVVDKP